ncbi:MAG: hypothetical protein ACW98F_19730, partial [Candidatus Hodarchaeales archaeon]
LRLSSKENLISSGLDPGWHEYTFDNPVLLRGGITYFVVMNETNTDDVGEFWYWLYVQDGRDDGTVYYKSNTHAEDQWTNQPGIDLPLEIEVLPVEYNGTAYVAKTYTNPKDVGFSYNTSVDDTALSAFLFNWNDTETHTFQTSTSVSFNLAFIANYTSSSNPLSGATSYFVQNATSSLWNVSFSTSAVNTTFSVADRTLAIQGLGTDWDGTAIFHGSTLVYNTTGSGGLNGSVSYITNSDTMTIHASALSTSEAWNVSFIALNYLLDLSLSQGGTSLDSPYQANVTDVLDLDFSIQATGNTSYWIDYPNGSQVRMGTDVNSTHTSFSEEWNINASVDQTTNVNGTYGLQAFYISSDKTKVGTFTRQLAVFINTSLDLTAEGEVIRGELFNVSSVYTAIHNNTGIKDVTIWCNTSWTTNVTMTPLLNGSYTVSLGDTLNEAPGYIGTVIITTQVGWFVNWTEPILVRFVESSTLEVNTSLTLSLEWRENTTLVIKYNDSSTNGIPGASITVDGDSTSAFWEPADQVYYFKFNSTKYGGEGTYTDLTITATHTNYLNQQWLFNLTITKGITDISALGDSVPLTNDSTVIVKSFANSSADQITLNLQYFHILSGVNLDTSEPVIESPFPYVSPPSEELNLSWTIRLNPDKSGSYLVNISYSLPNFTNAKFIVHLTIENAKTVIETPYVNGTNVLYENVYDFTLTYNNTDYNEKITFVGNDTILISAPQQVSWLGRTGDDYNFRFASTPLGVNSYSILFTFQHEYYDDASILILINVIPGPTTISGNDINGTVLVNNSETYTRYFSPND